MTNFEKLALESVNTHAITDRKAKKGIGADGGVMSDTDATFADSLYSLTAQTAAVRNPEGEQLPDTWQTGSAWDVLGSVTAAKEYLKKTGVDTENRIPTHTITKDQRDWLASRHDLDAFNTLGVDTPEFGDLMADLYYLNIISESEALAAARADTVPNGGLIYQNNTASLYKLIGNIEEDEAAERADTVLKYLDKLIESERERLEEKQEQYYLDFIHGKTDDDLLNSLLSCYSVISELLFG